MQSFAENQLQEFALGYLNAIGRYVNTSAISLNQKTNAAASDEHAEKVHACAPTEIYIWVLTELIEQKYFGFIHFHLTNYHHTTHSLNNEFQQAIVIFITAYENKRKIVAGEQRNLTQEIAFYQAVIAEGRSAATVKDASIELSLLQTVVAMVEKIKARPFIVIHNYLATININEIFYPLLNSIHIVLELQRNLTQQAVVLLEKISHLAKRSYKDEEQRLLETLLILLKTYRQHKIHLIALHNELQPIQLKALTLPHKNLFYQSLGLFGLPTQTAGIVKNICLKVDNTIYGVHGAQSQIDKHLITPKRAVKEIYTLTATAKPTGMTNQRRR